MNKHMEHVIVTVGVLVLVVICVGIYAWSGLYNIGADDHHWSLTYNAMQTVRDHSIHARSEHIKVPTNLDDPQLILKGAGQYAAMCTGCHLSPGVDDSELRAGMYPQPPNLSKVHVDPQDAFWVIKHGIKMSAMPAWGMAGHDDPTIWSMVAFIEKLPGMTPAQYKAIVAKAPPDEDMDMSERGHNHGHAGDADGNAHGAEGMKGMDMSGDGGHSHGQAAADGHAHSATTTESPVSIRLEGIMLLWFLLTGLSVLYVAIDIQSTPESTVLKWGFVLLTAYTGPLGAFLYVLGCREPLSGLHERYVAVRWRQVLGSTMHCVAGDGVGILAGAVIASVMQLTGVLDVALEYVLGFGFGWTIFQALFMRGEDGYKAALRITFFPELLSMNVLMAGMVPTMMVAMMRLPGAHDPFGPTFWFVMSMALLVGFIMAYPMNWWLVSRHLKHGMMTVRPSTAHENHQAHDGMPALSGKWSDTAAPAAHAETEQVSRRTLAGMTLLSFLLFAVGLGIAALLGGIS